MLRLPTALALFLTGCNAGDNKLSVYNAAPVVSITNPPNGSAAKEAELVTLSGLVDDNETQPNELLIQWTSTLDGVLQENEPASNDGITTTSTGALTVGNHTITLSATDESGLRTESVIQLTIEDVPDNPTVQIVHPVSGESGRDDGEYEFAVLVADEQDDATTLAVVMASDVDGEICTPTPDAAGEARCSKTLTQGEHHLTFTVTDSDALTGVEEFLFTVASGNAIDDDEDGWTELQGDCDDANANANPRITETYNGIDDDCNSVIDDHTSAYDDDGDGQTELDGDCDDDDDEVYAGAAQVWDAKDNDCDTITDEGTDYYDDDGDGYPEIAGDCDDGNIAAFPGGSEVEDGADNDCDTLIDEGTNAYDDDGDTYTENGGDCDDTDDDIYPGATEDMHNYVDEDCNGVAEEDFDSDGYLTPATGGDDCNDGDASTHPYASTNESDPADCTTDADGDDYGDSSPASGADAGTDCDDSDADVSPDGNEECDGADNDCDGSTDEQNADGCSVYYYDYDGDGYGSDSVTGRCYCAISGYYTSAYDTDCYDYNSSASPAATTYSTSQRGDGSYDWNCDGVQDKYWKSYGGACGGWPTCGTTVGWTGSSARSCSSSGTYYPSGACTLPFPYTSCSASTSTYTQKCL